MILKSFSYKGQGWDLSYLAPLGMVNLLVGQNATGKTRTIKAIQNVTAFMQMKKVYVFMETNSFSTEMVFVDPEKEDWNMTYVFQVNDGVVEKEILKVKGEELIKRTKYMSRYQQTQINPPSDKLIVQVRRDKDLYPEIEQLMSWAEGVVCVSCSNINAFTIMSGPDRYVNPIPFSMMVDALTSDEKKIVISNAKTLGYDLTNMSTVEVNGAKFVLITEKKNS